MAPYGVSKLCGEHYVELYNRLYGERHVILRRPLRRDVLERDLLAEPRVGRRVGHPAGLSGARRFAQIRQESLL